MEGDLIKINDWLLPLSWLYGVGVGVRNHLFDLGVLPQQEFSIPVIDVGNITVGGSGKTPHVEYLIRLLHDKMKVGVLSRGYKRKSRGYVLADNDTPMRTIGDEPFQMKRKFPDVYVAVDKNRREGIQRLTDDEATSDVDVILLDDAYQHRYVKPGINILLVDYHRLIIYDKLLPAGRLREPMKGKNRADIVIVTKCPKDLKPMEFRVLTKALDLFPYQALFFTRIDYDELAPVFPEAVSLPTLSSANTLLLTGIASPRQMELDLKDRCRSIPHGLRRPPPVHRERCGAHQPSLRQLARATPHHHHRERRHAPLEHQWPEPGGEESALCAAHTHTVHARPRRKLQPQNNQLCTQEFKKQHPG